MSTIRDIEELAAAARALIAELLPRNEGATLVTLSGELGAGKTAFVKEVARALGIDEEITSPTFVLEKIYVLPPGKTFHHLVHIDAYRLADSIELSALGFDELMEDAGNLILLEWPEQVSEALPKPSVAITLAPQPDGTRELSVVYP
jgi:tRNA threonylcarbamoyladenosine biosynthesis protein TsaE